MAEDGGVSARTDEYESSCHLINGAQSGGSQISASAVVPIDMEKSSDKAKSVTSKAGF